MFLQLTSAQIVMTYVSQLPIFIPEGRFSRAPLLLKKLSLTKMIQARFPLTDDAYQSGKPCVFRPQDRNKILKLLEKKPLT
ncbi:MAG: hypothetical protein EBT45_05485 [Alphaproteobacteria bacterium]|nr:hypothetical protein [Alphaproteobacteria bacterium]